MIVVHKRVLFKVQIPPVGVEFNPDDDVVLVPEQDHDQLPDVLHWRDMKKIDITWLNGDKVSYQWIDIVMVVPL